MAALFVVAILFVGLIYLYFQQKKIISQKVPQKDDTLTAKASEEVTERTAALPSAQTALHAGKSASELEKTAASPEQGVPPSQTLTSEAEKTACATSLHAKTWNDEPSEGVTTAREIEDMSSMSNESNIPDVQVTM